MNRMFLNFIGKEAQLKSFDKSWTNFRYSGESCFFLKKINKGVNNMHSIAKNRTLREEFRKHMLRSIQKPTAFLITGSVLVERVEGVRRTAKFQLDLTKLIDCFLEGYCNHESNLVSSKEKTCQWSLLEGASRSFLKRMFHGDNLLVNVYSEFLSAFWT